MFEIVEKVCMDFLDGFVLDVVDECLDSVKDLLSHYKFVGNFVLYHH